MQVTAEKESSNVAKLSISEALRGFEDNNEQEEDSNKKYDAKWSEVINSPTKGDAFAPCRELNKETSLHGGGIKAIIERANGLQQIEKRMVRLIRNIADLQENFGQAIGKSCHFHNAALRDIDNDRNSNNSSISTLRELRIFSKESEEVSKCLKDQVAQDVMTRSLSTAQNISQMFNKYVNSREAASKARRKALKARLRYVKSIQEAQSAIADIKKNNSSINTDNPVTPTLSSPSDVTLTPNTRKKTWDSKLFGTLNNPNKTSDRLLHLLNSVQKYESLYTQLVHEENDAVEQCVSVELQTIESLQVLEVQRFKSIYQSFSLLLQIKYNSLDNTNTAASPTASPRAPPPLAPLSPFIFNKKRPPSLSQDESPLYDASCLDLPSNVAALRSQVKTTMTAHTTFLQMIKSLSALSDDLAGSALELANGLQTRLNQEGYNKAPTSFHKLPLSDVISQVEATRLLVCWDNSIVPIFSTQSTAASELAAYIKNVKQVKIDSLLVSFETQLRNTQEQEDTRWKNLCEAVRNETKANTRYEQSTAECDKALTRFSSVNNSAIVKNDADPQNPSSATSEIVNKALGNMFSILPSKGEAAMGKMLTAKARHSIAKVTYGDAELKLAKDSELMGSAASVKKEAMESYTLAANAFLSSTSSSTDNSNTSQLKEILDTLVKAFKTFHRVQKESLDLAMDVLTICKGDVILEDLSGWIYIVQQRIEENNSKLSPSKYCGGFSLSVQLEDWEEVQQFLTLLTFQSQQQQLSSNSEAQDDIRVVENDETDDSYSLCSTSSCTALEKDASSTITDISNNVSTTSPDNINNESTLSIGSAPSCTDDNASIQSSCSTKQMEEEGCNVFTTSAPDTNDTISSVSTKSTGLSPVKKNSGLNANINLLFNKTANNANINSLFNKTANNISNEVFLSHFWENTEGNDEDSAPPSIIESYSCAYWPQSQEGSLLPLLHGRMFITSNSLYFVGWGGKKIILQLKNAVSITKEANMMGAVDNSLRVYYKNTEDDNVDTDELPSYYFGSFLARESCFQIVSKMISEDTATTPDEPSKILPTVTSQSDIIAVQNNYDVPPDEVLSKMEIVVDKKLRHVSISKFYDLCWSDKNTTSLYGSWLTDKGSIDVVVTEWEFINIVNPWCGEAYTQKRIVTFQYRRTTHLYIGPPIATVQQTQYCRVEDENKCVMAMTVKMDGIPYADVFSVECRWVASRAGNSDVKIQAGILVDFKKYTMLKSKIRDGTIKETSPAYLNFYEVMQKVVKQHHQDIGDGTNDVEEEEEEEVSIEEKVESHGWNPVIGEYNSKLRTAVSAYYQKDFVMVGMIVFICFYLWQQQRQERWRNENDIKYLSNKVEQLEEDIHLIRTLLEKVVQSNNQTE